MTGLGKQKKADNRGSALLLVIVVLSFITVLGLTVQAAALVNRRMKNVDQASKDNFYSAEAALEEIKTNLETRMTVCAEFAYKDVLENYSKFTALYYSTVQLQEYFRKQTIKNMCSLGAGNDPVSEPDGDKGYLASYSSNGVFTVSSNPEQKKNIVNLLTGYMNVPVNAAVKVNKAFNPDLSGTEGRAPYLTADLNEYRYLIFKNISIEYIENGYLTTITTDIRIKVPDIIIDPVNYAKSTVFLDYIFITDGKLQFTGSGLPIDVKGNLYAKSGVAVKKNKKIEIRADKFISGGDVTVGGGSELMMKELLADTAAIWANGFETERTYGSDPGPTYLTLNGTVNLADDLTLNAGNSQVVINGTYYGFGTDMTSAGKSSAIAVNGAASKLTLNVSKLLLAGRNFISHSEIFSGGYTNPDYRTGEGLALKSNQLAYLVPEEYIKVGHNPILGKEDSENKDGMILQEQLTEELGQYLDPKEPFQKVFYHNYGSVTVYYYLNFKDPESVKEYFKEYSKDKGHLIEMEDLFRSAGIEIADGCEITADSNIVTYNTDAQGIHLEISDGGTDSIGRESAAKQASYDSMMHTLGYIQPEGEKKPESVFGWLIDEAVFRKLKIEKSVEGAYLAVIDDKGHGAVAAFESIDTSNVKVTDSETKKISSGLIVADSVTVSDDFTGLIIAKNGITVRDGASYSANSVIAGNIIENVNQYYVNRDDGENGKISMKDVFNGEVLKIQLSTGETGKAIYVELGDLMSYENWSKN